MAILSATICASAASAQPLYTVTDLGRLPGYTYMTVPLGINNRGEVVGFAHSGSVYRAFVWDAVQGLRALPPVPGEETRSSTALAINDLGEIIGYSGQSGGAHRVGWLYRAGQYTMLGTIPGYDGCLPAAINNHTEIVGSATGYDLLSPYTNFYWSPATGMVNVSPGPLAELYGINDAGVICGGLRSGEPAVGIMTWDMRSGVSADLGMLPGSQLSFGYDLNESGRVAGVSVYIDTGGHRTAHAVYVDPGQAVIDLSIFQSTALGINERGEMVGSRPFGNNSTYYSWMYSPQRGLIPNLQAVVQDAAYFSRVSDARDINDVGQIIAIGNNGHFPNDLSRRALLLTPIVACPTIITQPQSAAACPEGSATYSVEVGGGDPLVRWQCRTSGTQPWFELANGAYAGSPDGPAFFVAGADTAALSLSDIVPGADPVGPQFRVRAYNACGSVTSNPADLTIGGAACPPTCNPDVNCDGALNGFDIEAMEQAVNGDMTNYCVPDADYNLDGAVNGFDVEAVEQGVNGAPC